MNSEAVFIGIDVACAKKKRLPVCFASLSGNLLEPLELPGSLVRLIPNGSGNQTIREEAPFRPQAEKATAAIKAICEAMGWTVGRIAIDAPAMPGLGLRTCEAALFAAGLSAFKTPHKDEWPKIQAICRTHLQSGGDLARLPYANKIWMLYGFELFAALRRAGFQPIETYPFAIVRALLPAHPHKSTPEGYGMQLSAVAERTGWGAAALAARLTRCVGGAKHDRLDAFMAAWIASSDLAELRVYGNPQDLNDAIWAPRNVYVARANLPLQAARFQA